MIKITDKAKNKMVDVLIDEKSTILRFGLQGGGCNGFQYFFSVEENREEDDIEIILDGTHFLVIDFASNMYLEDAEIDYKKDLMGESFVFNNPSVKSKCGCNQSVGF